MSTESLCKWALFISYHSKYRVPPPQPAPKKFRRKTTRHARLDDEDSALHGASLKTNDQVPKLLQKQTRIVVCANVKHVKLHLNQLA